MLQTPAPVLVVDRFPALLEELLSLLSGLNEEEWQQPVHGGEWTVKDLAQHLLGDEVNILSGKRDGYTGTFFSLNSWEDLVALINRNNALWVEATRRMSPRLVCELLRSTGEQVNDYFRTLDLFAAGGPVNWAGPQPAPVWLDVAREFTERWHHQQHIREAVGKPGCDGAYYLGPVLSAFLYALPQTFRGVEAPEKTAVTVTVTGEGGGVWSVLREGNRWQLYLGRPGVPQAEVVLPAEIAWRLFTRGISKEAARRQAKISGDLALAEKALETVAIIA
jgi:uncharacterized protein (TIGR03083 family)